MKESSDNTSTKVARLYGLDSLRFILALWVVFFHIGISPIFPKTKIPHILTTTYYLAFNGQAAVIIFFIISGLCIHFSQRENNNSPYAARC
ncbi:acyltransferase family protein [Armatimonas sp.]|uniref:acyltransferase family protein n=1 Tax=Armatimonas sp. TaxID=1872638 RepID=UPI00374CE8F3